MAEILIFADKSTFEAAEEKYGVSARSIWRWKAQIAKGKMPHVAELVRELTVQTIERVKDLLEDVYEMSLQKMKDKMSDASYRDVLDTAVQLGGLKAFRDGISDGDSGSPNTVAGSGGKAGAQANAGYPGGTGVTKVLRAVG